MHLLIKVLGCLLLFTSSGLSSPQQTLRERETGNSLQQPAEIPNQLYDAPTVPPPTVPTIPPRQPPARPPKRPLSPPAPPSQPDQLYTQPQTGVATDNKGSVLFPGTLNPQSPPGAPNAPASPPSSRPTGPSRPPAPGIAPPQPQGGGAMVGMPYEFEWDVNDLENGNVYSHVQSSDGAVAQGSYRVLLPDGRLQIVEFMDRGRGYEATVRYEVYSAGAPNF